MNQAESHPRHGGLAAGPKIGNVRRRAFSLLEVILALAIFTGAIAVLGELARQGVENARHVRDLSQAQLLCESVMAELNANLISPQSSYGVAMETDDPDHMWLYDIDVQTVDEDGLLSVNVTVRQDTSTDSRPVGCSLVRWMIDPTAAALSSNSTSDSSSSSSSSSGSSSESN